MRTWIGLFSLIALVAAAPATVGQEPPRPKIALVLSGGGAAGVAHVGVIQELEKMGLRPDIVTGTSMGAVVGGLYASGFTPEDLERAVTEVDWTRILDDASERDLVQARRRDSRLDPLSVTTELPVGLGPDGAKVSAGLVDGVKLTLLLRQMSVHVDDVADFDDLPIRFRAVATDLLTGQPVVLGDGDLGDAMRASMSIPGFFPPVKRDGMVLVDGGVTNNLPIDVARDLGADIVIASFIPPARAKAEDLESLTGTLGQSMAIFIHARSRALISTLSGRDVLLTPGVEEVGMLAFDEAPDTISKGIAAVDRNRAALQALAAERAPLNARPGVGDTATQELTYARVIVEYDGRLDPEIIRRRLDLPESGTVTPKELEIAARRVYGLDLFESVTYRFERRDGERVLVVKAVARNQGFLKPRVGVVLSNVFGGDSDFTLSAGVTVPELNSRGGRAEIDFTIGQFDGAVVDLEQPLDKDLRFFANTEFGYISRRGTLFADVGDPASEIDVETLFGRGILFWSPDDRFLLGPAIEYERNQVTLDTGEIPGANANDRTEDRVLVGAVFNFDTIDDVDLPTNGFQLAAQLGFDLFDEDRVGRAAIDALGAYSFGRHTLSPYIVLEGELSEEEFSPNFVGGFPELPGFDDDELIGNVVGATGLRYYRRADFVPFFGSDAFVGGSVAYGGAYSAWEDLIDQDGGFLAGSVFTGVETVFGPAIIGFGAAEQGQYSGTLTLGTRF